MIFGGLYTSHIVSAQENNTEKLNAAEIALNEDFVKQFPYVEQFTDEDGVSARRIKAPDTAVNTKPKGYEKEITRKVNYKDKKTGKTLSRVYQTIRFYGTKEPENTIPETKTEEKKVPQLPQTGESVDGGMLGLALASLATAIFMLKTTLKEKVK